MLMAAIMMVMGAFVSLIDVGFYQNWIHTDIGHWLDSEVVGVRCGQIFDSLSAVMLVVVSLISLVVYIYSIDYLATDPFAARFVAYLLIFTFLMLVYVTADTSITCVFTWYLHGRSFNWQNVCFADMKLWFESTPVLVRNDDYQRSSC